MKGSKGFALADSLIAVTLCSVTISLVSSLVMSHVNAQRILQEAMEENEQACQEIYEAMETCIICTPTLVPPVESEEPWQENS